MIKMKESRGKYKNRCPKKEVIIKAIEDSNGIVSTIAKKLRCSWGTAKIWIEKTKECREALVNETEKLLDLGESALVKNIKAGDERAIEFLLSTKGKHRGFTTRQEITGADGEGLKINITIKE